MESATNDLAQYDVKPHVVNGEVTAEPAPAPANGRVTASPRQRTRRKKEESDDDPSKRRCVSTACIACRKRKSKCDGNVPACAACKQVYNTECVYDPTSDHRRKGVYKRDIDNLKTRNSTLHTLIQAILNYSEDDVATLVHEIRTCDSLDAVAERVVAKENGTEVEKVELDLPPENTLALMPTFETQLYSRVGDLRLDEGAVRYIGGTSNLIHLRQHDEVHEVDGPQQQHADPITSWTTVTNDPEFVIHLLNMYFTWHYTFFTTLSKTLFYRDFLLGPPPAHAKRQPNYCSPLLVNAILALGCHFTSHTGARTDPEDGATAGDHFFREAKRLIMENDEHEKPRLTTVQAMALMSVREAGCGREAKGWVYSGMAFRMACDMGLNLNTGQLTTNKHANGDEAEEDVRRVTFWGCYLFDKCWSNYLGRLPQLPTSIATVPKFEVFPDEDAANWSPYTDSGFTQAHSQPARTRAVGLQISKLCEISNDLMKYFYNPSDMEKARGKSAELKLLSDIHTRLEAWRRELPKEMEPREGGLASILVMHMFFQLLFIHLFRPFLRYTQDTSPLPHNVSPRKLCTQAAAMISKLMRLYKRSHGLRQICNIAVYMAHSACTIHLLNLPDRNAKRDIVHGVRHLEEIAEGWLCARRTLVILSFLATKWKVELPEEAATVLARTDIKFADYTTDITSPPLTARQPSPEAVKAAQFATAPVSNGFFAPPGVPATVRGSTSSQQRPGVRGNGDHRPPPSDFNTMRPQQYPSASATPQDQQSQRSTGSTSISGTSPSDMFGGVDQLLHESNNWVYKDQAQFATGFENWTPIDVDPSIWANCASTGSGGAVGSDVVHNRILNMSLANPSANVQATAPATRTNVPMNGAYAATDWGNAMNSYNPTTTYNEEDWYQ